MFCPSCGFEYTQKTKYCKRCGESMSVPASADASKMPRSRIAGMFWAIAMFCVLALVTIFNSYGNLAGSGLRGDELIIPFVMGLFFTGAIAGLLIWMLARMIAAHQKTERNVIVEKHIIREAPPAQLGAPTDPIQQAVDPPSVVEHTTRQFAGKYNG
jgi:hypothetical protein